MIDNESLVKELIKFGGFSEVESTYKDNDVVHLADCDTGAEISIDNSYIIIHGPHSAYTVAYKLEDLDAFFVKKHYLAFMYLGLTLEFEFEL